MQNRARMHMYGRRAPGRTPGVTSTAAYSSLSSNSTQGSKRRTDKARRAPPVQQQQQQQQTLSTRPAPAQPVRRPPSPPSSSSSSSSSSAMLDLPCYVPIQTTTTSTRNTAEEQRQDSMFAMMSSSTNGKAQSVCEGNEKLCEAEMEVPRASPWSSAPTCVNTTSQSTPSAATPDLAVNVQQPQQAQYGSKSSITSMSNNNDNNNTNGSNYKEGRQPGGQRAGDAAGCEGNTNTIKCLSDGRDDRAACEELAQLQAECARRNVPFFSATTTQYDNNTSDGKHNNSTTTSTTPHTLYELDIHLLMHILSYCDVASLSYCGRTCVRFYVLCNAPSLWLAQAQAQNITLVSETNCAGQDLQCVTTTAGIKAALKAERLRRQAAAQVEEDRAKAEYAALERRIAQRASLVLPTQNDPGTTHNHATMNTASEHTTRRLEQLQQELGRVETLLRDAVGVTLRSNEAALRAQQAELQRLHARLQDEEDDKDEDNNTSLAGPAPPPRAHVVSAAAAAAGASSSVPLTYDELCAFERRMTRLVLCGRNLAPATLAPQRPRLSNNMSNNKDNTTGAGRGQVSNNESAKDDVQDTALPVVLRRGIVSFGELELLCLQQPPLPPPQQQRDTSAMSETHMPGLHAVQERWAAFKRFFPLGEDYYTAMHVLRQQGQSGELGLSHRVRYIVDRVAAFVRRIQAMKEHEVLDVVM